VAKAFEPHWPDTAMRDKGLVSDPMSPAADISESVKKGLSAFKRRGMSKPQP
jgi:hypothetical protein